MSTQENKNKEKLLDFQEIISIKAGGTLNQKNVYEQAGFCLREAYEMGLAMGPCHDCLWEAKKLCKKHQ